MKNPQAPTTIDVGDVMEDPRGRVRTVPVKVLRLGMGRNGTESLCTAFTMLGIPTYHGVSKSELFEIVLTQEVANHRKSLTQYAVV